MRKVLALLTLTFAALVIAPGAASAQNYGSQVLSGRVSAGSVTEGGQVTFCGEGFAPGARLTISEDGRVEKTVTADSSGAFCVTVTVEGVGTAVLSATGARAGGGTLTVTARVQVLAAAAGAGLPRTGADGTATQIWLGVGLLGLGAGMVALTVARRREGAGATA